MADNLGIEKQKSEQDVASSYKNPWAVPSVVMDHFWTLTTRCQEKTSFSLITRITTKMEGVRTLH